MGVWGRTSQQAVLQVIFRPKIFKGTGCGEIDNKKVKGE